MKYEQGSRALTGKGRDHSLLRALEIGLSKYLTCVKGRSSRILKVYTQVIIESLEILDIFP